MIYQAIKIIICPDVHHEEQYKHRKKQAYVRKNRQRRPGKPTSVCIANGSHTDSIHCIYMIRFFLCLFLAISITNTALAQQSAIRKIAPYLIYVKFPDGSRHQVQEKQLLLKGNEKLLEQLATLGW